jgi:carbonic anhydrase
MTDAMYQPSADELLAHNEDYVARYSEAAADLALEPKRHLAVVACMDSRMDVFAMLGLDQGEAHVIRNAGGVVTDDVIRSLVVSQRLLNTREILLLHHTDCGLQKVTGETLKDDLEAETGVRPSWSLEAFKDPFQDVRQSIRDGRFEQFRKTDPRCLLGPSDGSRAQGSGFSEEMSSDPDLNPKP